MSLRCHGAFLQLYVDLELLVEISPKGNKCVLSLSHLVKRNCHLHSTASKWHICSEL